MNKESEKYKIRMKIRINIVLVVTIVALSLHSAVADYGNRPWIIRRIEDIFGNGKSKNVEVNDNESYEATTTKKLSPVIFGE